MSSINMTAICTMTQEQFISYANTTFVTYRLILLFFTVFLVASVIGLLKLKKSRGLYMAILGLSALISSVLLIYFIALPNNSQNIINWITNLFS